MWWTCDMPNSKCLNILQLIWKWQKSADFGWICTATTTFPHPRFFIKIQEGAHTLSYQVWQKVLQISNYLNEMSWAQKRPNFDVDKQILKKIQKNGKLVSTLLICNLLTHPNSKLGFWTWVVVKPSHTWLSGRSSNEIHPKSPSSVTIQPHAILFLKYLLQFCVIHQYKQLCNLEFF